ncbi:hypothetical protein Tco_0153472 [Tanacetum coccineum]
MQDEGQNNTISSRRFCPSAIVLSCTTTDMLLWVLHFSLNRMSKEFILQELDKLQADTGSGLCGERSVRIGQRKCIRNIIDISSDSSDDRRWAAKKASAPVFYGPSTQGLLDAYGYGKIEEYLEWNYFPSTYNENTNMETTNKGNTYKDCIDDSNSAMSKGKYVQVCKKNNPNMYSHVPVIGCVLGLACVTTWDEIEKKMGARKTKTYVDKAKGK